jgi:hypothetical protein
MLYLNKLLPASMIVRLGILPSSAGGVWNWFPFKNKIDNLVILTRSSVGILVNWLPLRYNSSSFWRLRRKEGGSAWISLKDRLRMRSSLRMVNGGIDSFASRFSPIESRSREQARSGSGRPGVFCTRVALEGFLDMWGGRDGDHEMADISRVIPDGAGEIRLSPGGSCEEASRFEVTLICIYDAQFQRE